MPDQSQFTIGSPTQGLRYLNQIPTDQLYRLYVEPILLNTPSEKGPQGYDKRHNQHGSAIISALDALLHSLQNYPKANNVWIDEQLIYEMHERVIGCYDQQNRLWLRSGGDFSIKSRQASYQGIRQFLWSLTEPENTQWAATTNIMLHNGQLIIRGSDTNHITNNINTLTDFIWHIVQTYSDGCYYHSNNKIMALQNLINHCNQKLYQLQQNPNLNVDQVIYTIAYYVQRFEQLHPLADANGRVFVNNMTNYLLINFGLPPVIYQDPYIVDMHSVQEVADAIKQGCQNTIELIQGTHDLHGFHHHLWVQSLPKQELERFKYLIAYFATFQQSIKNLMQAIQYKHSSTKMIPIPTVRYLAVSLKDPNLKGMLLKQYITTDDWHALIKDINDLHWLLYNIQNDSLGLNNLTLLLNDLDESALTSIINQQYDYFLNYILPLSPDPLKRVFLNKTRSTLILHITRPNELVRLLKILHEKAQDFYGFPRWLFATLGTWHLRSIISNRNDLAYLFNHLRRLDHYVTYKNHLNLLDYLTDEGIMRLVTNNQELTDLIYKTNNFYIINDLLIRLSSNQVSQLIGNNLAFINVLRALGPAVNTHACEQQCNTEEILIEILGLYLNKTQDIGIDNLFEENLEWRRLCQVLQELNVSDTNEVFDWITILKSTLQSTLHAQTNQVNDMTDWVTIPPNEDEDSNLQAKDKQSMATLAPRELKALIPKYRDQRSLVLQAVQYNGLLLKHASPELQADPVIVQHALRQNYEAIHFTRKLYQKTQINDDRLRSLIETIDDLRYQTQCLARNIPLTDSTDTASNQGVSNNWKFTMKAGATLYRELVSCVHPCFKTKEQDITQLDHFIHTALSKAKMKLIVSPDTTNPTLNLRSNDTLTGSNIGVSQAISKFNRTCYQSFHFGNLLRRLENCLIEKQQLKLKHD